MHDIAKNAATRTRRLPAMLGRGVLFGMVVLTLLLTGVASSQQTATNAALEELRRRTPSGDNDNRIIDDWLQKEFTKIGAAGPDRATDGFRTRVMAVRNDPATTKAFRDTLVVRLGVFAKSQLTDATGLPLAAAEELVRVLIDADDPRTQPGLIAGLSYPKSPIRYLSAQGLKYLRDRIAAGGSGVPTLVAALRQSGIRETNGVVVERIYGALSFANPTSDVVDALLAILDARLTRYRKGALPADQAEATAIEYLSNASLTAAQGVQLVKRLAVLLRLDVEHYTAGGVLLPQTKDILERRICQNEELIVQIVQPPAGKGGNVCREMGSGAGGVKAAMQLELINWIGSKDAKGILNAAPWSIPVEAP